MLARPKVLGCAIIFLYILGSAAACKKRGNDTLIIDADTVDYVTFTTGVETLISDSGVTKYKLTSPKWYTYTNPEEKWYFPEGLYVEQFDTLFNIEASIKADTAYYYKYRQLWELKGNVEVLNIQGQRFSSQSLFWDEAKAQVYSHEHIKIERASGQLIESDYGFRGNQDMTWYELYSSHGHIDIEDKPMEPKPSANSAPDTTMVNNQAVNSNLSGDRQANREKLQKLKTMSRKSQDARNNNINELEPTKPFKK